ncbi:peptidase S8/S53 domain-containing protein, partial [Hyaloscypha sp. PMI_1271]
MAPININGNVVDPAKPQPGQLPSNAANTKFIILQCLHRLSIQEYDDAQRLGIQALSVEDETPDHTSYLCRYDKDDLEALRALAFVQEALVYVPDFVMDPSIHEPLSSPDATSTSPDPDVAVTITLHDTTTETGHDVLQQVQKLGRGELIDANDTQLRVRIPRSSLADVAQIDCVRTIERTKILELRTAAAFDVLGAGLPVAANLVLRGKGEVIAVADKGFDMKDLNDIHPAFKTKEGQNRVIAILNSTTDVNHKMTDPDSHGTHVAACAVGAMEEDLGVIARPFKTNRINAPASEAGLVVQVIEPGVAIPDLTKLFNNVATTYGAKIHNNSWGSRNFDEIQDPYTYAESRLVDLAMVNDRELLIVWAAGNDGHKLSKRDIGGSKSQKSYVRQIGCEAAAKNVVTVGGTINKRRVTSSEPGRDYCVDGEPNERTKTNNKVQARGELWLGSSKGPTCELRLKPDVVAPAVSILSARTRQQIQIKPEQGGKRTRSFEFKTGTSQAAPLVAGCAAVLRQALKSRPVQSIATPSGALIKALLVNGARDLAGKTFKAPRISDGKPAPFVMPPAPNCAQGFGEVNLELSLKSAYPSAAKEGNAVDSPPLKQGETMNKEIDVPAGKKNIRVTMAYNDKPGTAMNDIIKLTL